MGKVDKGVVAGTGSGMVVGGAKRRPVQLMPLVVGIVVLALVAGGGLWWLQGYLHDKKAGTLAGAQQTSTDVQDLALNGKGSQAQQSLKDALNNPQLTQQGKYTLLFQQGVTYEGQKNYTAAIASYKQADAIQQTQSVAEAIARAATAAGDKQTAIDWYKKAIARIPSTNPVGGDDKKSYQQAITALGGQP